MATYHDFDEKQINEAMEAIQNHHSGAMTDSVSAITDISNFAHIQISGGCISVTVENGKVCVNLPFNLGSACLPIPASIPNGTAAQACIHICTTWKIPSGAEVTVSVAGVKVVSQSFGRC